MIEELFKQNTWILLLLVAWAIPWKGIALWKAARKGDKRWFIALLLVNTLGILEIFYIFWVERKELETNEKS